MPEVKLHDLCKTFSGDVKAVNKLNLTVKDEELLVLVGPSGCGKSTTLRMLAGLETQTEGQIFIGDKEVSNLAAGQRNIGMVFQNYALYPHKTIYQNLSFGLKIRKVPKKEIQKKISSISQRLAISTLLKRYPAQLSGGQKQRVALARALLRDGDIILFDEPLSNLDASLRQQLRFEIAQLHRERKFTGIFVTHDQVEAMTLGDRIAVMDQGEIRQIETPENVYKKPTDTFVASFIGTPAMNLISGQSHDTTFTCPLFELAVAQSVSTIGFRPEHIKTSNGDITFSAEVIQSELRGMDWIIHCRKDNTKFCCYANKSITPGTTQQFSLSASKLHYFDDRGVRLDF